ncbi:outer membrane protein [Sedimentitalea nanhaiensis]|uniref:Opacity protein n=1 Tax=Sedimentitalea nanhaiensis TaxID=999627 RepID=A0A1I7BDF2_9RHOB|nr:outer membrane beta-barrel protein [Sedimentitalea nanhaiensis]SFT85233.1 Opacity protein [Sedimentitalea nanhaiensis]
MRRRCISATIVAGIQFSTPAFAGDGWYGFYAGGPATEPNAHLSFQKISTIENPVPVVLHAGYNHSIGRAFVLGGEINLDSPKISDLNLGKELTTKRVKARLGYDLGPMLIYGILGYAEISADDGQEDGYTYDLGVKYKLNDSLHLSAGLGQDFRDFQSVSTGLSALNFRVSYQF